MQLQLYDDTNLQLNYFLLQSTTFHCWNSLLSNIPGTEEGLCKYNEQGPNKSIKVK